MIGDNKIKLKSWKGDYLHRPDSPQGVTTWNTGIGNEWMVEVISIGRQASTGDADWPFPLKNDDWLKLLLWLYYYKNRRDFRYSYLYLIDLSFKDLSYINFSFSYLLGGNFAACNLLASNFGYAYLAYAYFGYAYIGYSYFGYAYLGFTDFSEANLNYSDLSYAYLAYAKLKNTNLSHANLSYAYLVGADLSNADLTGANLTGAILIGANLTGVKLTAEQKQGLGNPLWYTLHQGTEGKTNSSSYTDIPNFGKLTIDLTEDTELLLTLNVPDTWNNKEGINSWFAITVDGQVAAAGLYRSATPGQRVPINVSTVKKLTKGTHSVAAQWNTDNGGDLMIGAYGTAILSASLIASKVPAKKVGKIVVNADEWMLGNAGFQRTPDSGIFATNIAKWFTGGRAGKFHAYSTNFGLVESKLAETMTQAGHTWTTGLNIKFDLATLLTYDAIFVGGNVADNQVLIEYVKAGGNVYVMAGTGAGGSQAEADRWNTFIGAFGFKFAGQYNGISGNVAINGSHPILAGVKALYQGNGNSITDLTPDNPQNTIVFSYTNGQGLIAVFEGQ